MSCHFYVFCSSFRLWRHFSCKEQTYFVWQGVQATYCIILLRVSSKLLDDHAAMGQNLVGGWKPKAKIYSVNWDNLVFLKRSWFWTGGYETIKHPRKPWKTLENHTPNTQRPPLLRLLLLPPCGLSTKNRQEREAIRSPKSSQKLNGRANKATNGRPSIPRSKPFAVSPCLFSWKSHSRAKIEPTLWEGQRQVGICAAVCSMYRVWSPFWSILLKGGFKCLCGALLCGFLEAISLTNHKQND